MPLLLSLLSSALWGTADFFGGTLSRRIPAMAVVGGSQAVALVAMLLVAAGRHAFGAPLGYLGWGVAAGLAGSLALGAFYEALATGTMGVVSPIAATGIVVPVVVGMALGDRPGAGQLVGIVLAIAGVVLASGPDVTTDVDRGRRHRWRPIALALVAALGFGGTLVFIAQGAATSTVMTVLTQRLSSVLVVGVPALLVTRARGMRRSDLPTVAAVGLFDVGANFGYGVATTSGLLSVTSVLASLYPVATLLLARSVHHERLTRLQSTGVVLALGGVVLIAAGSVG